MPVQRLPLIANQSSRNGSPSIDARGINMLAEKDSNGNLWSFKRPVMSNLSVPNGGAAAGIALTYVNNLVNYTSASSTPLIQIYGKTGFTDLWYHATNTSVTQQVTTNSLYNGAYFVGADCYPGVNNPTQEFPNTYLLARAVTGGAGIAWTYNPNTLTWTSVQAPYTTNTSTLITGYVPGVVQLDGTFYVMTNQGVIYNSAQGDPTTWNNEYIVANAGNSMGVALGKQLGYLVAFKYNDIEFFYDAGNASGSPLGAVPAARIQYGCGSAASIQYLDNEIFFVASTGAGEPFVAKMENIQSKKVSTPEVDRILANTVVAGAATVKIMGHRLYILYVTSGMQSVSNYTNLVYDDTMQTWSTWTNPYGGIVGSAAGSGSRICLSTGILGDFSDYNYIMGIDTAQSFTEDGVPVTWELITPPFDGGSRERKYLSRMDILTDNTSATPLQVRWSDDDQVTWSNWRNVSLNSTRPSLTNCGTFRRRTFHFRHAGPQGLRLQAVDLHLDKGTL